MSNTFGTAIISSAPTSFYAPANIGYNQGPTYSFPAPLYSNAAHIGSVYSAPMNAIVSSDPAHESLLSALSTLSGGKNVTLPQPPENGALSSVKITTEITSPQVKYKVEATYTKGNVPALLALSQPNIPKKSVVAEPTFEQKDDGKGGLTYTWNFVHTVN